MIGSTGVGKTEIARRLAKLVDAPFIKVEASKFTEVGYVGRDVESIIRDITEQSIAMVHEEHTAAVREKAEAAAEERVLDALLPRRRGDIGLGFRESGIDSTGQPAEPSKPTARHGRNSGRCSGRESWTTGRSSWRSGRRRHAAWRHLKYRHGRAGDKPKGDDGQYVPGEVQKTEPESPGGMKVLTQEEASKPVEWTKSPGRRYRAWSSPASC